MVYSVRFFYAIFIGCVCIEMTLPKLRFKDNKHFSTPGYEEVKSLLLSYFIYIFGILPMKRRYPKWKNEYARKYIIKWHQDDIDDFARIFFFLLSSCRFFFTKYCWHWCFIMRLNMFPKWYFKSNNKSFRFILFLWYEIMMPSHDLSFSISMALYSIGINYNTKYIKLVVEII